MHANSADAHLRTVLNAAATDRTPDDDSGLPSLKDGEYQAHARPSNKPVYAIHFVNPAGEVRSFQFVHLDSGSRFAAERIMLTFMGMEPVRVAIHGRNLWRLYDYIHQHRMPWIMVAGRDFAKDGETIVTKVAYDPVRGDEPPP
jgi:hypothetical protein